MILTTCLAATVVFIFLIWLKVFKSLKNPLPPGPWGIPIFGVLPFMKEAPHISFQNYYKKYGKICSFQVGHMFVVLLSDYELIKEAYIKQGDNFSGRPFSFPFRVDPEDNGIVTTEGYLYKQYKSFIITTIKNFGAIRQQFEEIVKENADEFVRYLRGIEGQSADVLEVLGLSVAQTYSHILLGIRLDPDNPKFRRLIDLCFREQRCYNNGVRIYLPWTKKIPIVKTMVGEDEIREIKVELTKFYNEMVEENVATYKEGSKDSFIHSWFTEEIERKRKDPNDTVFSRRALLHNIDMVLSAGYETTTTTIRWAFLFLIKYPDVQNKVIRELDEVVGQDRRPSMDDVKSTPYIAATILEIHRCATIGPLGVPHKNKEETILAGYRIPRSSTIYANTYAVHTNPDLFPEPEKFKPERFIDKEGKFYKSPYVIPFSMGKRQCPGEGMAHTEVFLYLSYILQKYRLEKANEHDELESNTRSENLSAIPQAFNLRFIKRF